MLVRAGTIKNPNRKQLAVTISLILFATLTDLWKKYMLRAKNKISNAISNILLHQNAAK